MYIIILRKKYIIVPSRNPKWNIIQRFLLSVSRRLTTKIVTWHLKDFIDTDWTIYILQFTFATWLQPWNVETEVVNKCGGRQNELAKQKKRSEKWWIESNTMYLGFACEE